MRGSGLRQTGLVMARFLAAGKSLAGIGAMSGGARLVKRSGLAGEFTVTEPEYSKWAEDGCMWSAVANTRLRGLAQALAGFRGRGPMVAASGTGTPGSQRAEATLYCDR